MKRILFGTLLLLALVFGVRAIVRALASDETKIRWRIEEMAEGFNDTRMNPILAGLAQDFVDETTGARKDDARAGLAQLFLQRKDPQTKQFPYRARVPEEQLTLSVQPGEPRTAAAQFVLECEESHGEAWSPAWKAKVRAELALDSSGWRITGTHFETIEGKRLR